MISKPKSSFLRFLTILAWQYYVYSLSKARVSRPDNLKDFLATKMFLDANISLIKNSLSSFCTEPSSSLLFAAIQTKILQTMEKRKSSPQKLFTQILLQESVKKSSNLPAFKQKTTIELFLMEAQLACLTWRYTMAI